MYLYGSFLSLSCVCERGTGREEERERGGEGERVRAQEGGGKGSRERGRGGEIEIHATLAEHTQFLFFLKIVVQEFPADNNTDRSGLLILLHFPLGGSGSYPSVSAYRGTSLTGNCPPFMTTVGS